MPEPIDRRSRGPCPNTERSSLLIDTPVWLPPTIATSPDCTRSSIPSSDDGRREETVAVVVLESHSTPMTAPAITSTVAEPISRRPHGDRRRRSNRDSRSSRATGADSALTP